MSTVLHGNAGAERTVSRPARVRGRGVAALLRPRSARRRAARPARRQPFRRRHRHVGLREVVARRAGLRPALQRGYLIDATSRWRFATMRPGGAPIEALADALAGALGSEPVEKHHARASGDERGIDGGRRQGRTRTRREPSRHRRPVRGAVPIRRDPRAAGRRGAVRQPCCSRRSNVATCRSTSS